MTAKIAIACLVFALFCAGCGGAVKRDPAIPEPLPKDSAQKLLSEAQEHVGEPYRYGGTSASGWDCSGFVCAIFRRSLNINLPRSARDMFNLCSPVPFTSRKAGDLVFFRIKSQKPSHVGILMKRDKFIHVSISDGVIVSSLDDDYYRAHYIGLRRISPSLVASSR
jgi:cell wall-associated NlpC family hydrolase